MSLQPDMKANRQKVFAKFLLKRFGNKNRCMYCVVTKLMSNAGLDEETKAKKAEEIQVKLSLIPPSPSGSDVKSSSRRRRVSTSD